MKTLIVYCSTYKSNTEKIAKVFAEGALPVKEALSVRIPAIIRCLNL